TWMSIPQIGNIDICAAYDDGSQDRNSVLHIACDEGQIGVARVPCGSPNALPGALAEWLYGRDQAADFRRGRIGDLTELTIADSKQVGDRTVLQQLFLVKCQDRKSVV